MSIIKSLITPSRDRHIVQVGNQPGVYRKENRLAPLAMSIRPGRTQPHQFDTKAHLKVALVNVYCYACQKAIAQDVSSVPLRVQELEYMDGEERWTDNNDHELAHVLTHPNPEESQRELSNRMHQALLSTGNGYWHFDKKDREIYYTNPAWVKLQVDNFGMRVGYEVSNKGYVLNLEYYELIHWRLSNPDGEYYGLPPGEVIKNTILMKLGLNDYLRSYFDNDTTPGSYLSTDQYLTPDGRKQLREELETVHQGQGKHHLMAILDQGSSIGSIASTLKDLVPKEVDELCRGETLCTYGVPPVRLGYLDGAAYANAHIQKSGYYDDTIIPQGKMYEEKLNTKLVPLFGDPTRLRVLWDENVYRKEAPGDKSTRVQNEFNHDLIKLNEAREELGYEPEDEDRGGESYHYELSSSSSPVNVADDSGAGSPPEPLDPDDDPDDDPDKNQKKSLGNVLPGQHKAVFRSVTWKALYKQRQLQESRLKKVMVKYFNEQLNRIMDKIKKETNGGKSMELLPFVMTKRPIRSPDEIDNLFDTDLETAFLESSLGQLTIKILSESGQHALDTFKINFMFNVDDPRVNSVAAGVRNRIAKINTTTYRKLQKLIIESYNANESLNQMAKKIKEEYAAITQPKGRALMIAETESGALVEGARSHAYRQAGYDSEWLTTKDAKARIEHVRADGQRIKSGEMFNVGGEQLAFPCDPRGSAHNVIRCRCTVIPVLNTEL